MDSYLQGSYLGESGLQIPSEPQPAAVLQPRAPQALAGTDVVQLPGGIVLPKKTLIWVAIITAALLYLAYRKKQKG